MSTTSLPPAHRRVALAWGIACHLSFAAAVASMIAGLYTGMRVGIGTLQGSAGAAADALLLVQFPVLHSLLLSRGGRRALARLAPSGLGAALGTTTFATIAAWQLLATFVLWSPLSTWQMAPRGIALAGASLAYAASWLLLLRTMMDAGLGVQTGYLGWGSVVRGKTPRYSAFEPRGTFRWVRQPVYVAFALILWTAPVWTLDHLIVAVAWTGYCVLAPLHKERRYLALYGERFERYRSRVPYWVPRSRPADLADLGRAAGPASAPAEGCNFGEKPM
ncbi:MAG TPA: isoprenylcysteine carboxylmethyltransferase family protein [Candidatus Binatia bacterium]